MDAARRERLSVGLLAAGLCLPVVRSAGFCLDDSFIHLAYVTSIRLGDGVSYNPGDWETGVSSPLWLALLALWPWGVPSVFGVKCLGALLHVGTALLVTASARLAAPGLGRAFSWSAGLLTASTPFLVQGATSGMEVPLAALLSVAVTLALLRERFAAALVFATLAYLARPETLVYSGVLSLSLAALRRESRPLAALAGSGLGMLAFGGYCLAVSGYFFPNTYYVKSGGFALARVGASLSYLAVDVAKWQPVVMSGAGIFLAGYGLYRAVREAEHAVVAVCAAGLASLLAIAQSRTLYPGVHFYQGRYFAIVLWVLPWAAAYGFARLARGPALALLAPLVAATALLLYDNTQVQLAQQRGVVRLHVEPAAYIARRLPDAEVVGVEGAGALRLFTPRSLRVVDLMGLNDRTVAHLSGGMFPKLCYLKRQGVTHLAYPAQWRQALHQAFEVVDLERFTEPRYAQMDPPVAWQLTVARVASSKPEFDAFCASRGL